MKRAWPYIVAAVLCLPIGTAWHEVVGHGLTGILMGGRITSIMVLGVLIWPVLAWTSFDGYYGQCGVEDVPTRTGELLSSLGGSLSTLIASMVALALLHFRRWRSPCLRAGLLSAGIWWIDILTYTLPTWGLRRSILWGGRYAEPYEAAVALGLPGPLFQILVVMICVVLATIWCFAAFRHHKCQVRMNDVCNNDGSVV